MEIPLYQVDAFTSQVFAGNSAAVCPLTTWLDDALMQSIAAENNLSETAFLVREGAAYRIRWFTPKVEVDLCGHATLAAAFVVFHALEPAAEAVVFESASGPLKVTRQGSRLCLDFPSRPPTPCSPPPVLFEALGGYAAQVLESRDYLLVYASEQEVRALAPDMGLLATLDRKVIVSAPAQAPEVDFVSRFFAPSAGIPEDPVTGSSHCTLVPYWARRLAKNSLRARQVSSRGGELYCEMRGDRVLIAGECVLYLEGKIRL